MSESHTPCRFTPEEIMQREEDSREESERRQWLTMLSGLEQQAKGLDLARSGVLQQAAAIRDKLGLKERGR